MILLSEKILGLSYSILLTEMADTADIVEAESESQERKPLTSYPNLRFN